MILKIKSLHPNAKIPQFAHATDAGLDLFLPEEITLEPNERKKVAIGIAVELPSETVGLIWEKSGRSNEGLKTFAGVIDEGYRGEISVVLWNTNTEPLSYKAGTAIVQMLIQPTLHPEIQEITSLSDTERGTSGFGSTDNK